MDESKSVKLEVSIPFELATCAGCGEIGAGTCKRCGLEIDPPAKDTFAAARRSALQATAERASTLLSEFESIAHGEIPLAADQFLAAVEELEIWTMLDDLDSVGRSLNGLDFGDSKVIGAEIRIALDRHLDKVEQVLHAIQTLAIFNPVPPAEGLFKQIKDSGCRSAELASALLELFRAPTYSDGEIKSRRTQTSWERFLEMSDLKEARAKVSSHGEVSLNARVELALKRSGSFLDEDGAIDPGRVLLSFSDEASPLDSLASALDPYFACLLDDTNLEPSFAPGLVGPLVLLAATERPVAGHGVARLMASALRAAYRNDPDAVRSLALRGSSEGPTIYAALSRVRRAFGDLKTDAADHEAADRIMRSWPDPLKSVRPV